MKRTRIILLLLTIFWNPTKAMIRTIPATMAAGTPALSSEEQKVWQDNGYIPVNSWKQYDACVEQLLIQHPDKTIILFMDLDDTLVCAPREHGKYPLSSEAFYAVATGKIVDLLTRQSETGERHVTDNQTAKKIAEQSLALFLFPHMTNTKLVPVKKKAISILQRYAQNPRIRIYGLTSRARQYAKITAAKIQNLGFPFSNQNETFSLTVGDRTVVFCNGIVFGAWRIKGQAAHALINHFGIAPESIGCVTLFDDSKCNIEPFTQVLRSNGIPTYNCLFTGRQRVFEKAKKWFEQQSLPEELTMATRALSPDYTRLSPRSDIHFDPSNQRRTTQSCMPTIKQGTIIPAISVSQDPNCPTPQPSPAQVPLLSYRTFYSLPMHGSSAALLKATTTNDRPKSPNPDKSLSPELSDGTIVALASPSISTNS